MATKKKVKKKAGKKRAAAKANVKTKKGKNVCEFC